LPLILAMKLGSPDEAGLVRRAIETGSTDELPRIIDIVRRTGALERTRVAAATQAERAVDAARALPANEYSNSLIELAAQLLQRRS